jgi:pilus assembly protein Flp/PilA
VDAVRTAFRRLLKDESGATAIEYGLIASLIVMGMMGGLSVLGNGTDGMWAKISGDVTAAMQ